MRFDFLGCCRHAIVLYSSRSAFLFIHCFPIIIMISEASFSSTEDCDTSCSIKVCFVLIPLDYFCYSTVICYESIIHFIRHLQLGALAAILTDDSRAVIMCCRGVRSRDRAPQSAVEESRR